MSIPTILAWALMAAASVTITHQDLRNREISLWTVIAVFLSAMYLSASSTGIQATLSYGIMNILFLFIQLGIITLFYGLTRSQWNIFDTLFGWGDVAFIAGIAMIYSTVNFLIFYTGSLIITLTLFLMYRVVSKKTETTVPLAGVLSIQSCIFIALLKYFGYAPWDELPMYLFFT